MRRFNLSEWAVHHQALVLFLIVRAVVRVEGLLARDERPTASSLMIRNFCSLPISKNPAPT